MITTAEAQKVETSIYPVHLDSLSIVIPAYNEENRIKPVLDEICSRVMLKKLSWDIIVSIDGDDRTETIVKNMMNDYPFLSYIKGNGRSGKGGAIKRAIASATGDYVMLMDADGAIAFDDLAKYLDLLHEYDLVNFDRYKSTHNYIPGMRRFVSRGYNIYVKILFGLKVNDTQSGYKIMKTSVAKEVFGKLTITNGFFYSPMFYYLKEMNARVKEVATNYNHSDGSKFNLMSMILGGFVSALAFRIRYSQLWKYMPKKIVRLYYRKFRWI